MFDEKSLNTLEYGKILSLAAAYTQSEGGRRDMLALVPCSTLAAALRELSLTAEADRVLFEFSVSPSFAIDDIDAVLQKAEKGAVLSIGELLRAGRVLRVADRLSAALKKVTGIPLLSEMAQGLHADRDLEKRISDAFLSDTEVADGASHELKEIRRRIRRIGERVKASLQSFVGSQQYRKYLQDSIVTVRGDRYVIPVKSEFKGMIPGLVHDQSASGATLYVEPFVVVNLNNELKTEHMAEEAEIERILRGFSSEVASAAPSLATSCDIITAMDVVFAKAQYARATKAVRPELSSRGALMVTSADADTIVLVQDATEKGSMFPPAYSSMFAKPCIGVVTKSDLASEHEISNAKQYLKAAGAGEIFVVSSVTGEGVEELVKHLDFL